MTARNLFGLAIIILCLAGCDKKKKDDYIITRRDRGIVRFTEERPVFPCDPGNDMENPGETDNSGESDSQDESGNTAESEKACHGVPYLSLSDGILTISYEDSGIYNLYIKNYHGEAVYSVQMKADGNAYEFDISALDMNDLYVIVLEGSEIIFKWYFEDE